MKPATVVLRARLGDPFPVSAAVGKNSGDLLDKLVSLLPGRGERRGRGNDPGGRGRAANVAIEHREPAAGPGPACRGPEPGTTRDAIDHAVRLRRHNLVFIDTAGLRSAARRRKTRVLFHAAHESRDGARDVCLLVVDAKDGMHTQDLKIANDAWDRGAGVMIAVNKWD